MRVAVAVVVLVASCVTDGDGDTTKSDDTAKDEDASETQTPAAAGPATALAIVSGDVQTAGLQQALPEPLVVKVTDAEGNGVGNVDVEFFTQGDAGFAGGLLSTTVATDAQGLASVSFAFGASAGIFHALVRVPALSKSLSFTMTATNGPDSALLATIPVGSMPQGVAVDVVANKIYVGNNGNRNGCDYLVMPNSASNTITAIDGATQTATTVTVESSPIYATPNPNNGRIYVANSGGASVQVLDGDGYAVLATLSQTGAVHHAVVDVDNDEVWVNDASGHRALVLDAGGQLLATVETGRPGPHGIAINTETNRIYTTNIEDQTVTVIDSATRQKLTDIALSAGALGVGVNTVTNKIYIGTSLANKIVVIDGDTDAVSEIDVGRHTLEIAIDETNNRIYATSQTLPYSVAVIDGATDTLLGFHPVGSCPWGLAIDSTRQRLYVGHQGDSTVRVLDTTLLP